MKRALPFAAMTLAAALLVPARAHAWDDLGHKVVARVAWENMTPRARENAVALLRAAPEETGLPLVWRRGAWPDSIRDRELFVEAAVWADVVRDRDFVGNPFHRSSWHYVNYFWRQTRPGAPALPSDRAPAGDLVSKMTEFSGTVGSPAVAMPERAVQLAWLLHQVGDVHQPMHSSARISPESPEGDRGGNDFTLEGRRNLHSYWDGVITRSFRWGPETVPQYVGRIAATVSRATPKPATDERLKPGAYEGWARESFEVAKTLYPSTLRRGQMPPPSYDRTSTTVAGRRVAMAGYRLADLLNRTLGS